MPYLEARPHTFGASTNMAITAPYQPRVSTAERFPPPKITYSGYIYVGRKAESVSVSMGRRAARPHVAFFVSFPYHKTSVRSRSPRPPANEEAMTTKSAACATETTHTKMNPSCCILKQQSRKLSGRMNDRERLFSALQYTDALISAIHLASALRGARNLLYYPSSGGPRRPNPQQSRGKVLLQCSAIKAPRCLLKEIKSDV